jgi:hypothetical protein
MAVGEFLSGATGIIGGPCITLEKLLGTRE